jgi:hypothetical protein
LARLRNWFHHDQPERVIVTTSCPTSQANLPYPSEGASSYPCCHQGPAIRPVKQTPEEPVLKPIAEQAVFHSKVEAPAQKPPVKNPLVVNVGYMEDYSQITGQLSYVHTSEGGFWVLRYGAVDQEDRFGGSVVLAPAVDMSNFREGDVVNVVGEILKEQHAPHNLGGALYRANSISMGIRSDL